MSDCQCYGSSFLLRLGAEANVYILGYLFIYEDYQGLVEFNACRVEFEFETDVWQLSLIQVTVWHTSLLQLVKLLFVEITAFAAW